eukprot:SAG31_NODE_41361_length_276_cov_0.875706_1_plen_36_part_10
MTNDSVLVVRDAVRPFSSVIDDLQTSDGRYATSKLG